MRSVSSAPMPASGSSSSSTRGLVARHIATSSWRLAPWLKVPAMRDATSSRPAAANASRAAPLLIAHSCEAWQGEEMVGGLYGVSLGAAFFGESMFATVDDASKVAFVWFARQLRASWWLIFYLPAIALASWAGSARFGGHDYLTWGWDLVVVASLGLIFFIWGVRSGWSTPAVQQAIEFQKSQTSC